MKPILKTEYRKKRIPERIELARTVLTRALSMPKVLRRLDEFGYGAAMLREGLELVERAVASRSKLADETGREPTGAAEFSRLLEHALAQGRELRLLSRKAFARDRRAIEQLELSFPLPGTRFLMLQVLERLAHTLLIEEKFLRGMARQGMEAGKIDEIARGLSHARALAFERHLTIDRHEKAASLARQTMLHLDHWMSDFFKVAKVSLADDVRGLEAVGVTVVVRS